MNSWLNWSLYFNYRKAELLIKKLDLFVKSYTHTPRTNNCLPLIFSLGIFWTEIIFLHTSSGRIIQLYKVSLMSAHSFRRSYACKKYGQMDRGMILLDIHKHLLVYSKLINSLLVYRNASHCSQSFISLQ